MQKNTPELWDSLWEGHKLTEKDIAREEVNVRWQRMERRIIERFGSFSDLSVIEVGCGAGTNAVLMARKGAKITMLDYSDKALQAAEAAVRDFGLKAELVCADALNLPADLKDKYDVCMSFGLAEHFTGKDRETIIKAHYDLLKPGGICFISVPNRHNPPYRLFKFIAEHTGIWKVGEEYPFSRREFRRILKKLGLREYEFFGDSFISSLRFISPFKVYSRLAGKELRLIDPALEIGTAFDERFSYALVLCIRKGGVQKGHPLF